MTDPGTGVLPGPDSHAVRISGCAFGYRPVTGSNSRPTYPKPNWHSAPGSPSATRTVAALRRNPRHSTQAADARWRAHVLDKLGGNAAEHGRSWAGENHEGRQAVIAYLVRWTGTGSEAPVAALSVSYARTDTTLARLMIMPFSPTSSSRVCRFRRSRSRPSR